MPKELYFDISSEDSGGSLYRVTDSGNSLPFYYNHSTYDADERFQMVLQASLIRAS